MPIYAYKCDACGHAKDVLQKVSDAPLTDCPACGQAAFRKQLTAAGFQLKGSGWYATDFRNPGAAASGAAASDAAKPAGDAAATTTATASAGASSGDSGSSSTGGAAACGPSCACH